MYNPSLTLRVAKTLGFRKKSGAVQLESTRSEAEWREPHYTN